MKYKPKRYYIKTLGCQANVVDSGTMAGILNSLGFEAEKNDGKYKNETEELLDILPKIDLFIINTCSVRQKSEDKVYGLGKVFAELKKTGEKLPFVIISGCMVGSATGERKRAKLKTLKDRTPWSDYYMNPSQIFDLPNVLKQGKLLGEWVNKKFDIKDVETVQFEDKQGFINISNGCDNFCTFCVVPYAREHEVSRSEKEILMEAKHLAERGYKNIMLCGQNVNSWGLSRSEKFNIRSGSNQKLPFADLLRSMCGLEGLEKIEFISSNPFDFTKDLVDAIKHPKISNYFHIAVQSGNNEVLEKMNRRHTIEEFISLVEELKKAKPNVEIGTDIIVGFPGETREQFMDTVKLFEKVTFNVAFISIYSTREGTVAQKTMEDDVSLKEKKWRHDYLSNVWKKSKEKN
ncbi:MiaB/RimO family radical SAM methylthiotransferase [Patescibacteria group bacterium]